MVRGDDGGTRNACAYLLDRHVEEGRGDRVAVRSGEQQLSYSELCARSAAAAGAFTAHGIGRGDRVMLLLPDGVALVTAFFGLLRIGAVAVPLSERHAVPELAQIVGDCRPAAAVVSRTHLPRLARLAEQVLPPRVWIVGGVEADSPAGTRSFDADLADASPQTEASDVANEDLGLILYTSGTTGASKGAVHVHGGLRASREGCFHPPFALSRDDLCFSTASLSFAYGLYALLHALAVGAQALLDDAPRMPHLILESLRAHAPSVLFSTPRVFTDVVALVEAQPEFEARRLRLCISSGEPVPKRLYERWRERFGLELMDVVGATETLRPFLVPDPKGPQPAATRRPSPGCELDLLDEDGRSVPDGQAGQLFVRCSCNAASYWDKERETAGTMLGGWVRTGDVAVRADSGGYVFLGRSDGITKVRGQKVVAGEIEECLREHDAVVDCALLIATGSDELATTVAFVEANVAPADHANVSRLLRKHCRSRLAPHKVPAHVLVVDALPRTVNGKIARGKLRETANQLVRAAEAEGRPPAVAAGERVVD